MMADETLVAVWDCRDRSWPDGQDTKMAWARQHFIPGGEVKFIYRAEFYDSPLGPRAKLYSYLPDLGGNRHWCPGHARQPHDHRACYIVEHPPRFVPLDELPPPDLLGTA